eukprot:159687-Amphidinium_carterae.1
MAKVSETNTSLMIYPLPINNTYVTGYRDHQNLQLYENETEDQPIVKTISGRVAVLSFAGSSTRSFSSMGRFHFHSFNQ